MCATGSEQREHGDWEREMIVESSALLESIRLEEQQALRKLQAFLDEHPPSACAEDVTGIDILG